MKKFLTFIIGLIIGVCVFADTKKPLVENEDATANAKSLIDKKTLENKIAEDVVMHESEKDKLIGDILNEARSHLGKRYVWATRGPKTFDCSGYVYYVFKQFGYDFSPSSRNQYKLGKSVSKKEAKKGDLIFFTSRRSGKNVGHVGIVWDVLDNGTILFIHASLRGVRISELEGYYIQRFVGIKRVL